MDLNNPEFQKKLEQGEDGLSQKSKKVLSQLLERAKTTEGTRDEKLMFVHAVIVTAFAWDLEGKEFSTEDVYQAFQSQAHFDAIFKSDWYTSKMQKIQDTLDSWASFNQSYKI